MLRLDRVACLPAHTHIQMAGHIHERQVLRADQLHRWPLEEAVVFFADEARIFDGFVCHGPNVGICADDAYVLLLFGV